MVSQHPGLAHDDTQDTTVAVDGVLSDQPCWESCLSSAMTPFQLIILIDAWRSLAAFKAVGKVTSRAEKTNEKWAGAVANAPPPRLDNATLTRALQLRIAVLSKACTLGTLHSSVKTSQESVYSTSRLGNETVPPSLILQFDSKWDRSQQHQ